jgi:Haemolysin secretion/activation protein ShlB/FhaC/HecB
MLYAATVPSVQAQNPVTRIADSVVVRVAAAPASAEALLSQARATRLRVDSSLQSYDALSRERFTLTLALRGIGRERTLSRDERAGNVQWSRANGLRINLLGRRRESNSPFGGNSGPNNESAIPVPYFPGKEPLWGLGSSFVTTGDDANRPINPLAAGAETSYRYTLGDSLTIGLPDGSRILLRELRATPRSGNWRVLSASLWFETATAQLVRAAYRYATPVDFLDQARRDPDPANRPPRWLGLIASPLRGTLEAVTVESGLFEGKYWLPRAQIADFRVDAPSESVVRGRLEQRFQYATVNGTLVPVPPLPPATIALRDKSDSLWRVDSTFVFTRDSLLKLGRSKRDTVAAYAAYRVWEDSSWKPIRGQLDSLRKSQCATTGTYVRYRSRYGRRVPAEVSVPCDSVKLANAPIFTGDLMGQNAAVWGSNDRAALIASLASAMPLALSPQPIKFVSGLEFFRYNRIEGISLGGGLRQDLGPGLRWEAQARASFADRQLNGEVFVDRAVAGSSWRVSGYRRLVSADDYGAPFVLGASIQNLISGLDERFYYRSAGLELSGVRNRSLGGGALTWRVFAEHQSAAVAEAEWVVRRLWDKKAGFSQNIIDTLGGGTRGVLGGAAFRWRATRGDEASGWRLATDTRSEAAAGVVAYGRGALDLTIERRLPARLRAIATGSVGSSVGELPLQRFYNLGGWQTVRGYTSGTLRGNSFWMGRGELLYEGFRRLQPSVFVDQGWAGQRSELFSGVRQLRSAGVGAAFFQGLFRLDAARRLEAGGKWRINSYASARF